jgi:hypothetical protein
MNEELRLGYRELRERLEGDIGRQVRQLALQSSAIARTAQSEYRGETARPTGMAEVIAMVAVQDFLDLCFDQQPPSRS